MKIRYKTGGLLEEYLPGNSGETEVVLEVADKGTPSAVMRQLNMPLEDFYLVIVNDEVVPKARRDTLQLKENDELGVYPPLKGG
ncbi:MAG TPA: hypothetical protein ENJ99_03670 [Rhizobiales bacterium]|nr:hypothetical protein [Hyphomicrobiales bacterium]